MAKNVIVIKKSGELIHANYLGRVVKEYSTYMGTALIHDGKLLIDRRIGKPTVEAVMELQTELQASQIVFCFGENKTLLEEDMMPYEIKLDDTNAIALFLEGNFQGYSVKDSSHVNEFHCKEDFLSKKLPKMYKTANAGMAGLLEELKDPLTQQELANCWTDRGFMTLLGVDVPAITVFNKGHIYRADYNWGTTSQSLGYVEKTEAKGTILEAPKEMSALERLKAKIAGKPIEEAKAPAALPPEKKTETSVVHNTVLPEDLEWVGPAPNHLTNAQKSDWWKAEVGYVPDAYKKSIKVQRKKGTKEGVLKALKTAVAGTGPQPELVQKQQTIEDAGSRLTNEEIKALPDKKEAPEHVKDTSSKHVSMENMPVLSPRQKIVLKTGWMKDAEVVKTLGDDFKAVAFDPKRLKEFEDNYQTFYDGMGLSEDTWLSFEALMKLGAADIKALAQYAFNRQNDHVSSKIKLSSIISNPANKIDRKAM